MQTLEKIGRRCHAKLNWQLQLRRRRREPIQPNTRSRDVRLEFLDTTILFFKEVRLKCS